MAHIYATSAHACAGVRCGAATQLVAGVKRVPRRPARVPWKAGSCGGTVAHWAATPA